MICPVCKKDTLVVEYKQIELDYCQSCKGIWFDSGELELLLEKVGVEGFCPSLGDMLKLPEAHVSEKKRKCPICTKNMRKVKIGGKAEVVVDVCGECHGLWFDGGEVASLMKIALEDLKAKKETESEVIGFLQGVFLNK